MSPSKVSTVDFRSFSNSVDGKPRLAKSVRNGINPTSGENLWDVPIATKQDVDDAVVAARRAFLTWSKTSLQERRDHFRRFRELYLSHKEELIALLSQETGKPRHFAEYEISAGAGLFEYHESIEMPEDYVEDNEKEIFTRYVPLGVVGAIAPWNFPIALSNGKVAPALIAGNCVIVKPSPFTPYTALKIAELAQEVFPPGVYQAVGGDDQLGPWLTGHPGIQKISFTGSIATGKKVAEDCARTLKRVTLELGGNDASIVLPDVDIQKTAPMVILGAFNNSGQICVASKRIFVHSSIYKEFLEAMTAYARDHLKIGSAENPNAMLGPVQNAMQYERVKGFFSDSVKNGYKFQLGSGDVKDSKGYFIQPTIIDNPPNDSRIMVEEPFGPIVPVQPWTDEEDVIRRANDTQTGLGAAVWSADAAHARKVGEQLEAGNIFINSFAKPTPQAFFSGHKESGIGGEYGKQGLLAYCNAQAIHVYK